MSDPPNPSILLAWYDQHARTMPWRIGPADKAMGIQSNPYHVWLSEVMLQQTTVAAVKSYFIAFTTRWPTVFDLAAADDADVLAQWAGLGYYARARNLIKCARTITHDYGGVFPKDGATLLHLPGIGPYTAAAIAAIAFDEQAVVVDGNVERVMSRIFAIETPLPDSKPIIRDHATALTPIKRPGDYAQAVMDLGATICKPKSPACAICPWTGCCAAQALGIQASLPRKQPKAAKPVRYGIAYVAIASNGSVLLERRPEKGLLGGMLGWPGSEWAEHPPMPNPPFAANWQQSPMRVRHTFTHFHLELEVMVATNPGILDGFVNFNPKDLPTVMRKVWKAAQAYAPS